MLATSSLPCSGQSLYLNLLSPTAKIVCECRAYSAYWRLSWPAKPAVTVQGAAVMSAVDDLVQQAKSGTDVPKPKLSPAFL